VWRAANGINSQDPRPTGTGGDLGTAAALWKQRLDWCIARSIDSSADDRSNQRQAADTAHSRSHHDNRRPYQTPGQRSNGPAAPGRYPPGSKCCAGTVVHPTQRCHAAIAADCRIGLYQGQEMPGSTRLEQAVEAALGC
jgi:hypothetical protein